MATMDERTYSALPLSMAGQWLCECGARGDPVSPSWRYNGKDWEHHHGYPMGHVTATRNPSTVKADDNGT